MGPCFTQRNADFVSGPPCKCNCSLFWEGGRIRDGYLKTGRTHLWVNWPFKYQTSRDLLVLEQQQLTFVKLDDLQGENVTNLQN